MRAVSIENCFTACSRMTRILGWQSASRLGGRLDTKFDTARRLLVVDDEPVQCLIVTRAMATAGFSADSATSLEEASRRIASCAYDVIVLDLALGGQEEGISLLRLIAASPSDPIVVLVSRLDQRVRAATARYAVALGLRVAGALAKPVGATSLQGRLCLC